MDWSDEYLNHGASCPFEPNAIKCDEYVCADKYYSCGDGECVHWRTRMAFQRFAIPEKDCFNKRNINHMCEVSLDRAAWTLESGLCLPDKDYDDSRYPPWNIINTTNLNNYDKCQYLLRCLLSKGFEHDCPCNHQNCTQMMINVCQSLGRFIPYPLLGLINSNHVFLYNYNDSMGNLSPKFVHLHGGVRCRGYFFQLTGPIVDTSNDNVIYMPFANHILCTSNANPYGSIDYSSPHKNDKLCWNGSLTFNGRPYAVNPDICTRTGECISQYRIRDGIVDCLDQKDETIYLDKNYCTKNVGQHRFQCFNGQYKCLSLHRLGTGTPDCSNSYDESLYGAGTNIRLQISCNKVTKTDCHRVKAYIQQSSTRNSSNNSLLVNSEQQGQTNRMPFHDYCDSFWNLDQHIDEMPSSCQYWICQNNQYQCQTGQCIPLNWVCDGEWDCSDASDEEAIVLIKKWSNHNSQLSDLPYYIEKCRNRSAKSPFSNICNISFEFDCYRSNVSNPLDIKLNRPCINLTQIGNGVEDCYNAYDEKNTFTANSYVGGMWGFHFRCTNDDRTYLDACNRWSNCTEILCSYYRNKDRSCSDTKDFICLEDDHCKKNARCNGERDCSNGEDEYWCPSGTHENQVTYRHSKVQSLRDSTQVSLDVLYPPAGMLKVNQQQLSKSIVNLRNDQSFKVHSYKCNRGIAIIEMNEIRCLCPPAYYGD